MKKIITVAIMLIILTMSFGLNKVYAAEAIIDQQNESKLIKIKENAEDQEETEENACSGIEKYEYYIDGKKYESNEITNLTIGNTYLVYVIAFDKASISSDSLW